MAQLKKNIFSTPTQEEKTPTKCMIMKFVKTSKQFVKFMNMSWSEGQVLGRSKYGHTVENGYRFMDNIFFYQK